MVAEAKRMLACCSYRSRKQGDKVLGEYARSHVAEGGVHFELYIPYISYFDLTCYQSPVVTRSLLH